MTYNGHKNYNAWNVSLWIANDEGLYRLAMDCIRHNRTKENAAREMLALLPDKTPDGAPYSLNNVRAALIGM